MSVDTTSYNVLNGPNADSLFAACRHAYDENITIPIVFTAMNYKALDKPIKIRGVQVLGIKHEGSRNNLMVEGNCTIDNLPEKHRFKISYNTESRHGYISIFK